MFSAREVVTMTLACLGAWSAAPASARPLEDCARTDPSFHAAYRLLTEQADVRGALAAWVGIDIEALSPACRAEARELRAICLIEEDRGSEARALYRDTLDEVPEWRPDPLSPGNAAFELAHREWFRTHAGPPQVTRLPLRFRSDVKKPPSGVRPLIIGSQVGGELSWEAEPADPWVRLSKTSGTTSGERDTLFVSIDANQVVTTPGVRSSRVIIRAVPWRPVSVPIEVEWTQKKGGLFQPLYVGGAAAAAAAVTAILLGGGDSAAAPPGPPAALPEPGRPPGERTRP